MCVTLYNAYEPLIVYGDECCGRIVVQMADRFVHDVHVVQAACMITLAGRLAGVEDLAGWCRRTGVRIRSHVQVRYVCEEGPLIFAGSF